MGRPRLLLPGVILCLAAAAAAAGGPGGGGGPPPALAEAETALGEGRTVEARRALLSLSAGSLPDGPARRRAAAGLMKLREFSRAADLLAGDPPGRGGRNGEAALLRLESLVRSGRLPEARTLVVEMEGLGVGGDRRRVLRAMLDLAGGNAGDAHRELEDLVRGGTRDADAWILRAQLALDNPAEAERRLLSALGAVDDRVQILRALGRLLLRTEGGARRAVDALEEVVKARPWERESALDLVSALRRTGGAAELARARRLAEELRRGDPADFEASLAFAEVLGETARVAADAAMGNPAGVREILKEAIAVYGELAGRPAPDPVAGIRVLQGLGRAEILAIFLDAQGDAGPTSHFRAAIAALERADAMDPGGKLRDGRGRSLRAETLFLMARAHKRVHSGDGDHTTAVALYEEAARADPLHLDAKWDLALLYFDFLRTPEYVRKARRLADRVVEGREAAGLPPLDAERQALLDRIRVIDDKGEGFQPGDLPGGEEKPEPKKEQKPKEELKPNEELKPK